ncbi:MAG: hypothetical protein JXX28_13545 [Deltaproteobacteria bacterium]|nr:hypothetical protein [Deltaproteobacteria bacterium]
MRPAILTAALGLFLAGCEDVDSSDVLTSGMWANISVQATGDGSSDAITILKVGGATSNTYVEMTGDDALSATLGEESLPQAKESLGDFHQYRASFSTAEPGVPYTVSFTRTVDEGAPETVVTLPEPFEIDDPAAAEVPVESFSRAAPITLTWGSSGTTDAMELWVTGDCIKPFYTEIAGDPGTYTLEADTIEPLDDDLEASCTAVYLINRWNNGTLDLGYGEGGMARGLQTRNLEMLTTP